MSLCKHCIEGVRHEGTAQGKFEDIDGIDCYIATPSKEYPQEKALLFLTDVFANTFINNQLLGDSYAANGYKVIMPNLFQEAISPEALDSGTFDLNHWFIRNGIHYSEPRVRKVVDALKASGVTKLAVIGFCYGARSAINIGIENLVDTVIVSHPSLLNAPEDFENYLAKSKAPLQINSCEIDPMFPPENQKIADEVLGDGKFAPGYQRTYWAGCTHGFAVRGDPSNPVVQAGKEGAFKASVEWLNKYL